MSNTKNLEAIVADFDYSTDNPTEYTDLVDWALRAHDALAEALTRETLTAEAPLTLRQRAVALEGGEWVREHDRRHRHGYVRFRLLDGNLERSTCEYDEWCAASAEQAAHFWKPSSMVTVGPEEPEELTFAEAWKLAEGAGIQPHGTEKVVASRPRSADPDDPATVEVVATDHGPELKLRLPESVTTFPVSLSSNSINATWEKR